MSNEHTFPRIASPHGEGPASNKKPPGENGISISYSSITLWSNVRMTGKVMVATPVCIILELLTLPILPITFLLALIANFLLLAPRGQTTTSLNSQGLQERASYFPFSISWRRILWILNWGGDVHFCTFGGGCFIPREAFTSREEAAEFVAIARELKQSDGKAWRPEWNGRVFGVQP